MKEKLQRLCYTKKNPIQHETEKKMPTKFIPCFPQSASTAEKIAEKAIWPSVAKAQPIACFAKGCGFLATKLDQLRCHLDEKHDIQYLGCPSQGLKDRFENLAICKSFCNPLLGYNYYTL